MGAARPGWQLRLGHFPTGPIRGAYSSLIDHSYVKFSIHTIVELKFVPGLGPMLECWNEKHSWR